MLSSFFEPKSLKTKRELFAKHSELIELRHKLSSKKYDSSNELHKKIIDTKRAQYSDYIENVISLMDLVVDDELSQSNEVTLKDFHKLIKFRESKKRAYTFDFKSCRDKYVKIELNHSINTQKMGNIQHIDCIYLFDRSNRTKYIESKSKLQERLTKSKVNKKLVKLSKKLVQKDIDDEVRFISKELFNDEDTIDDISIHSVLTTNKIINMLDFRNNFNKRCDGKYVGNDVLNFVETRNSKGESRKPFRVYINDVDRTDVVQICESGFSVSDRVNITNKVYNYEVYFEEDMQYNLTVNNRNNVILLCKELPYSLYESNKKAFDYYMRSYNVDMIFNKDKIYS